MSQWNNFDKSPKRLFANLSKSYFHIFALYVSVDLLLHYLYGTSGISSKWLFCGILSMTTLAIVLLQISYYPQLACVPQRIPMKRTFGKLRALSESFGEWVIAATKDEPSFNPKKERRQRKNRA